VIALSTDDADTARKFRASLKAPYSFVADPDAALVRSFDVKTPIFTIARRITFVIGQGRKVLAIQEGSDALDPSGAVGACSLEKPKALQYLIPQKAGGAAPDGGR
jgi:thioredoxin-dependent peroxiredoxin